MDEVCSVYYFGDGDSFAYDPNPNSFNDSQNFSVYPPQPQYQTYSCELCGNNAHYGYDCPPQVPFIYNQDPCFNQNFDNNNFPQTSPSFPQQYLCCENCGGPHESFQCQPMNQNYYEPNLCYNFNYSGFDQPSQYSINHQPLSIQENLNQQKMYELLQMMQSFCEKLLQQKQAASIDQSPLQKMSIQDMEDLKQHYLNEMLSLSNDLQIKDYRNGKIDICFRRECESMIDELKGKFNRMSTEINKKKELQDLEQVANLSTYPSQRFKSFCYYDDDDYDYEKSTIPLNTTDSQIPLSNAITPVLPTIEPEDSLSMGDEHLGTVPEKESDKVIKSSVENLVPIPSESKDLTNYESECDMPICENDGLDDIFTGELAPIDPIPPGIVEADLDPKKDIRLIEKLLNDDSSPHSPEELNSKIPDAIIESFSPSPILVEDSDSLMEEIYIFLAPDDSIPPGIENDHYDSEGDVLFLEELLNDDSISLPEYESFHVDFYNVPSSPHPPKKPPDDDVYFDIEPDTRVLTTKVVDEIYDNSTRELYVHMPNVLPILPTLYPVFDTLLPFSSKNEDKFNPGILISKEEKSPHLLSHRGFNVFQLINDSESRMMIYRGDILILDVPYLHFYPS
ncbi:hypothetical protein Tco_0840095 [Tanacetum coccineum]|uniref:CCHC-type domain-containing protein n=1 Tax=Tanacetum coccineum TaxID=301880 RepID=A0ABQ5ATE7_9ASTR